MKMLEMQKKLKILLCGLLLSLLLSLSIGILLIDGLVTLHTDFPVVIRHGVSRPVLYILGIPASHCNLASHIVVLFVWNYIFFVCGMLTRHCHITIRNPFGLLQTISLV